MSDLIRFVAAIEKIANGLEKLAALKGAAALVGDILDVDDRPMTATEVAQLQQDVPMKKTRSKKAGASAPVVDVPTTPAATASMDFGAAPTPVAASVLPTLDACNEVLQNAVASGTWEASDILEMLGEFHNSRALRNIDPVFYQEIIDTIKARG